MSKALGWAMTSPTSQVEPWTFERREPRANDVVIDIEFCGVCHSDIHTGRNEWPGQVYPVVTGHEIIGRVRSVGDDVTKFSVGDRVGVGCMVDSCLSCPECKAGLEQYCRKGMVGTYGGTDSDGEHTQGGYSDHIVVREEFIVKVADSLDPAAAAPILCAGITTYSPLRHHNVGPGSQVGIAGFGGLGAMGVKLAKAMGAQVTVITRNDSKTDAAKAAGAAEVLTLDDADAVAAAERKFDVIISTIPKTHDVTPYLKMLGLDGKYVLVGAVEPMKEPYDGGKVMGRRLSITGSGIGGIKETQELFDFCAEHNIVSDVEIIPIQDINKAWDRVAAGEMDRRYVIDSSTLKD